MKKIFISIMLFFGLSSAATNVGELIGHGVQYDSKNIEIQGEIIGEIMYRNENVWINVLTADGNAIGVLAAPSLVKNIIFSGDYKHKGDIILVKGVFYRFSKAHSGETIIVADDILRVSPGYVVSHSLPRAKLFTAILIWILILLFSFRSLVRYLKFIRIKINRLVRR